MLDFCDFIQVYVFTTNHHLNLTDGNLAVFILPRSHARIIVVRRHGSVKSVYPLYLH